MPDKKWKQKTIAHISSCRSNLVTHPRMHLNMHSFILKLSTILLLLLGLCITNENVDAFVAPSKGRTFLAIKSSSAMDQEGIKKIATNPSTTFGSPLSDQMIAINKSFVGFMKKGIFDTLYVGEERDFARFYALETIARVPYFSYLAALHFYETIGQWRNAKYLKLHFAESINELHHLMIMEELGGADLWFDRFLAQHLACGYYAFVLGLFFVNPILAYNFNHAIEEHAYQTYAQFLIDNEEKLKALPAPQVALDYYRDGDLYMFDAFQIDTCEPRRPIINNLYDVFVAIREDELEHVKTMAFLQTDVELTTSHDGLCNVPDELVLLAHE